MIDSSGRLSNGKDCVAKIVNPADEQSRSKVLFTNNCTHLVAIFCDSVLTLG